MNERWKFIETLNRDYFMDRETLIQYHISCPEDLYRLSEKLNDYEKALNSRSRVDVNEIELLVCENKELKKQLGREETDKKRLMSYLMRYKGFGFDEIVEDFLDNSYYDNWWEDGFYEFCWDEYLKEKSFGKERCKYEEL